MITGIPLLKSEKQQLWEHTSIKEIRHFVTS